MKKISIYIVALMGLLITSCAEKLELEPYDGLTDEQLFSSADGFENAILGVYSAFRDDGYYGEASGIMITPDVMSDNLTFNITGRQTQREIHEWRNTALDESFGIYNQGYNIISRANNILDNIDKLSDNEFKDNIKGEALALRAMVHFDIARVYCKIPTQSSDANSSLGIVYLKSFTPDTKVRRVGTTVKSVYDSVIEDLNSAVSLIASNNGEGRLNKAAVYGILSRVYLYNGDYAKSAETVDKAISEGIFELASAGNYSEIWSDEYSGNIMFKIRVTDQDRHRPGVPYSQEANGEIRSEYVVSYELYQLYGDDDVRKKGSIVTSDFDGDTYNHVSKYLGRPVGDKTVIDGKYLRMEELYLNKSEALYHTGPESEALAALDEVRSRRYTNFKASTETGQALYDAIQLERRLELAFEGDRFFQLKRLALPLDRDPNYGEFFDGKGTPPVMASYPADGFRWQQPIPRGAFDNNPDLTDEDQNPGY